jgi:hypothetical protein
MVYYRAKANSASKRSEIEPVMPATPFIFEYFLFNSIYQHDWAASKEPGPLVMHETRPGKNGLREWEQQKKLLEHLELRCLDNPKLIERAFAPFKHLVDLTGAWTKIVPDHNLNEDSGVTFFLSVRQIQDMLRSGVSVDALPTFFEHIDVCREFVGKVRNNIFHGAKSLAQIWNKDQRRRIEVYHLVIQSINSLFFLTRGMSEVASDEVCHPIEIPSVPTPIRLSSMEVLELRVEGMMKKEDPKLIPWANEYLKPLRDAGEPSGAMFYPSAGSDIITPVLISLPFCTEFHFYDDGGAGEWRKALRHLCNILGNPRGLKVPDGGKQSFEVEFEYNGIPRRIFHVKADNEKFLQTCSRLVFFFHRGDSQGEGGSDQPWDGEWFARWKEMIPPGRPCAVLTDGIPYGLNTELARHLTKHPTLPSTPHRGTYSCGIIQS